MWYGLKMLSSDVLATTGRISGRITYIYHHVGGGTDRSLMANVVIHCRFAAASRKNNIVVNMHIGTAGISDSAMGFTIYGDWGAAT